MVSGLTKNFLFLQHVALTPDLLEKDVCDVTLEKLTETFNASVQEAENVLSNGNANPKTKNKIKSKLEGVRKNKEFTYRVLEEQLQQFLAQFPQVIA
jgi:hypothetical protein